MTRCFGTPSTEVTFDIDANGILNVSAKDKGTGKEQKIRIEAGSGLSKEEVEKMRADAKANEATDKAAREKVDKLNHADSLLFQTEKQLKEYGDKIPADKKQLIEAAMTSLKYAHEQQDIPGIDRSMADLNTAWNNASEDMYKSTQAAAGSHEEQGNAGTQGQQEASKSDDVTDVPFEEVK